jgi:hypothetical protein
MTRIALPAQEQNAVFDVKTAVGAGIARRGVQLRDRTHLVWHRFNAQRRPWMHTQTPCDTSAQRDGVPSAAGRTRMHGSGWQFAAASGQTARSAPPWCRAVPGVLIIADYGLAARAVVERCRCVLRYFSRWERCRGEAAGA